MYKFGPYFRPFWCPTMGRFPSHFQRKNAFYARAVTLTLFEKIISKKAFFLMYRTPPLCPGIAHKVRLKSLNLILLTSFTAINFFENQTWKTVFFPGSFTNVFDAYFKLVTLMLPITWIQSMDLLCNFTDLFLQYGNIGLLWFKSRDHRQFPLLMLREFNVFFYDFRTNRS